MWFAVISDAAHFHDASLTIVSPPPSAYSTASSRIARGVPYHNLPSTVRPRWLYHPFPSHTPTALAPARKRSVTSYVAYRTRFRDRSTWG